MRLKDFFKPKNSDAKELGKKELEIPPAPPSKSDLPTFPTMDEIPEIKSEKIVAKKGLSALERAEKNAIEKQQEELDERDDLKLRKPIFVDIEYFREIMNEIGQVQNTLKEGEDSLKRISEFKEDEDKEFKKWENMLKDVQRKLTYADKTLFK